jgi:hypothetical protein
VVTRENEVALPLCLPEGFWVSSMRLVMRRPEILYPASGHDMHWVAVGLLPNAAPTGPPVWDPVDIGHDVQLAQVPDYLRHLAGPGWTWEQLGWLVSVVDHVLLCPYELDVDPTPLFTATQRAIGERLILANLAVWLVNPHTDLRFRYVLHLRLDDGTHLRALRPGEPLHLRHETQPTTLAHLAEARGLHETLGNLPRVGPL